MVGLWDQANDEEINHMKIGVKTLVLGVILVLGYKNLKKDSIKNSIWATMLGLTVTNVLLAYLW
jgi:chromate transport protein ChrA